MVGDFGEDFDGVGCELWVGGDLVSGDGDGDVLEGFEGTHDFWQACPGCVVEVSIDC